MPVRGGSRSASRIDTHRRSGLRPLGLRRDLRVGTGLELARIGAPFVATRHTGLLQSLVVYVGGDTPIGPEYLGAAHSLTGAVNAYLFIGAP
jgi:NTE family protein